MAYKPYAVPPEQQASALQQQGLRGNALYADALSQATNECCQAVDKAEV
jgi:hypothetical protein